MSYELKHRRGTAAQHSVFVGALGEITVKTDTNEIVVHDGVTPGGFTGGGYMPAGTGAVATTVQAKLRESVSIQDLGGSDDWDGSTGTDNKFAFERAKDDSLGRPLVVRLPFTDTGVYNSTYWGYWWGDNITLDPDTGVILRFPGNIIKNGPKLRVTRPVKCIFTDQSTEYWLMPDVNWDVKNQFIEIADESKTAIVPVDQDSASYLVSWPNGPFTLTTSGVTTSSRGVSHAATAGEMRATLVKAIPKAEISAKFGGFSAGLLMAFVRTTTGFYAFNQNTSSNSLSILKKIDGQTYVDTSLSFATYGSQQAYWPCNARWTVRINSATSFSVLYEGVVIHTVYATDGAIVDCGFGFVSDTSTTVTIDDWVRVSGTSSSGLGEVSVSVFGNSQSDGAVVGAWPYYMREALDYSAGIRAVSVNNVAYSGDTSSQMLSLMQSSTNPNAGDGFHTMSGQAALAASNVVVLFSPETNDIQAGFTVATTESNVSQMIDICLAAGKRVVFAMAPIFYSKALAGNRGQNTLNYEKGGPYRQRLARLCAEKGVKVLDVTQVSGPILPAHIDAGIAAMNDNIHPNTPFYKVLGVAVAKAIIGSVSPTSGTNITKTSVPLAWMSAPWSVDGSFSVDGGRISIQALLDKGASAYTDGSVAMTFPATFRPTSTITATLSSQSSGGAFKTIHCQINTSGELRLYGAPDQYVWLGGLSWPVAWDS